MTDVPLTRQGDVVETLHGEVVADPYRWLEDTESEETAGWVAAQNAATAAYLDTLPNRDEIRARLTDLWRVTRHGAPYQHGGRWFFTRHDAKDDQPTLRVADEPGDDGRVLVDVNGLASDGTVALATWTVSADGRRIAYATSGAGSDWMTFGVLDVDTGAVLDDVVEWSKFTNAAWLPDASGFVYGAFDAPAPGHEFLESNQAIRLALHRIGSGQVDDTVIYADPDPRREPDCSTIGEDRWLVITTHEGTSPKASILVADQLAPELTIRPLIPEPDADARVVGVIGSTFLVLTDDAAPRKRIVAIDLDDPEPARWREIVAEGGDSLLDATQVGDRLVTHTLRDACSRLQIWSLAGTSAAADLVGDIELPPAVTVTELSGGTGPLLHFGLTSFTDPASVWSCDVMTGETRRIRDSALPIDADRFVIERAAAPSLDGTEIPMFLLRRTDTEPDGAVPTLLYGYGGFDIPVTPTFNAERLIWVERGGLLAIANLRGGGEFGQEWYAAGTLERKQNVFDDFAGCARWLANSPWTRADKIAINGRSNGGLLVGAVLTQHPELIGAAIPEVGVLDMLRYHKFTCGWTWMSDYADPDDPEQYPWVRAFSPLHAIRPGTAYPATLIMTADHDDRVVPGHSFKFAATLQPAQRGSAPILIRVETSGGHGPGTPVSKLVEARADMLAFTEAALR
jgi:prolyl oligopeptidase